MLTTKLKSFQIFVNIAITSSSITLSVTGIRLMAIPISAATACGLSIGNKVKYERVTQKYWKSRQIIKIINKQSNFFIKYLEGVYKIIYVVKVNMNVYVIFLLSICMEQKLNIFSLI